MPERPSKLSVLGSLEMLNGTFIKENESSILAIHDKVFDFLEFYIGKMLLKSIVRFGSNHFISQRMSFEFLNEFLQLTIL